jgi:hypothetical protein
MNLQLKKKKLELIKENGTRLEKREKTEMVLLK